MEASEIEGEPVLEKKKNIYRCWMLDNWTRQQVLASRPGRTQRLWGLWFGLVWFASIKDKGTFRIWVLWLVNIKI